MTLLKNLAFGLFMLVALLIVGGFALPDRVHVEREILINARPVTLFTVLDSHVLFTRWSPWAGMDPNTQYHYSGPRRGVGAKLAWSSNSPEVGAGSQEIVESVPYRLVRMQLEFAGFDTENGASFSLTPEGEGTRVVWGYDTSFKGSLLLRYFGLLMERMVGPDYERGLAQLKSLAESLPPADFSGLSAEVIEVQRTGIAFTRVESGRGSQEIAQTLERAYREQLRPFLQAHGLKQTAAPLAIYDACAEGAGQCPYRAAIPVNDAGIEVPAGSAVALAQTYGGRAVHVTHIGPYSKLGATFAALEAFMAASGYEPVDAYWEQYVSDPTQVPDAELRTEIYQPIR